MVPVRSIWKKKKKMKRNDLLRTPAPIYNGQCLIIFEHRNVTVLNDALGMILICTEFMRVHIAAL
jgi:hypothetical protein